MRKVVAHLIITLDGVVKFDAVVDTIMKRRNAKEVLPDFFAKVAQEDAMLLGRVTYQEWANYWPTSTNEPFSSHINNMPKYVVSRTLDSAPWGDRGNATLVKGNLAESGGIGPGVLEVDDCRKTYQELKAKGVEFLSEPQDRFYGIEALLKDNSGNWFSMTQRKE